MKKFYVTVGTEWSFVCLAVGVDQVCVLAWRKYFQQEPTPLSIPAYFIVSELGFRTKDTFNLHEGDAIVEGNYVTALCYLASNLSPPEGGVDEHDSLGYNE